MPVLETTRLILRPWFAADLDKYARLCADPEVMRWIGNGSTRSRSDCATAIAGFERQWRSHGFGLFAVEEASANACIGFCGLSVPSYLPELLPAVEIGWRLERRSWGRGLATEAARKVVRFALDDSGLSEIVSVHQIGNSASARIMEKLGMTFDRATVDPSCDRAVRVYRIRRRPAAQASSWRFPQLDPARRPDAPATLP